MWEDDRIRGVLKADFTARDSLHPVHSSMTDGSVEFQIRESNKRHNHKILEMLAKPLSEVMDIEDENGLHQSNAGTLKSNDI